MSARTDRELLKAAARAAGFEIVLWKFGGTPHVALPGDTVSGRWNPLTDDGDALRLATLKRVTVMFNDRDGVEAFTAQKGDDHCASFAVELLGDDAATAVRRAIVRAAAATGAPA